MVTGRRNRAAVGAALGLWAALAGTVLAEETPSPFADPLVQRELVAAARGTVEAIVRRQPVPPLSTEAPPCCRERRAVFVTLEVGGALRGCRGSLWPVTDSVTAEVRRMAEGATTRDRRYRPLRAEELARLEVTITIIERLEPIAGVALLGGPEHGLVVRSGDRLGVVLPYEGKAPETRLTWGIKKAGLRASESFTLERLVGQRFSSRPTSGAAGAPR